MFDGTGTPAYTQEINFSGAITDTGTGDYTLTIDRDFADANYTVAGEIGAVSSARILFSDSEVAGSIRIFVEDDASARTDEDRISVVLIGAQ
jgi:hypothetical protein